MKIDICLTATNTNPIYINQIPNYIKVWSLLGIVPRILLINHDIPTEFKKYEPFIILFDPQKYNLESLHTAYIAQAIRIYYPAIFPKTKTVMISDIDIMPISKGFFVDSIKNMHDDAFINYRRYNNQLNICYNVARASVWSKIFDIETIDDVVIYLRKYYHDEYDAKKNCPGWFSDQEVLTQKVVEYSNDQSNHVIYLDELGHKVCRLDKRHRKEILLNKDMIIKNIDQYTDYHMPSYQNSSYVKLSEDINEAIFALIRSQCSS